MKIKSNGVYYRYIGFAVIAISIILGFVYAYANRTIDAEYLEKYIKYPISYPLSEAPAAWDAMGGIMVAIAGSVFGIIISGIGDLICLIDGQAENSSETKEMHIRPEDKPDDENIVVEQDVNAIFATCHECGREQLASTETCQHCGAALSKK